MKKILLLSILILLTGCSKGCTRQDDKPNNVSPPPVTPPVGAPISVFEKQVEEAQKLYDDAVKQSDIVKQLEAQRNLALAKAAQAKSVAETYIQEAKELKKQVAVAKQDQLQSRLYVISGSFLILAIVAFALGVWITEIRKWAWRAALALGATSALCWFFGWLIPYIIWVGIAVAVVFTIAVIRWWRLDSKSLEQLVPGVDKLKKLVGDDYKAILGEHMDEAVDARLDALRERLGLKPKTK